MGFLKFQNKYKTAKAKFYTWLLKRDLGGIGKNSMIVPPFHSNDLSGLFIGNDCGIWDGGWIDAVKSYGSAKFDSRIEIGDRTYIGRNCHIIACDKMRIGKEVVIADSVYITDNLHGYENPNSHILYEPLVVRGPVVIDDQVWLGERVCVMPGVTIGRHSIIGSNSVVTKDIPPYSVAVGAPAKIIKQYNVKSGKWEKC